MDHTQEINYPAVIKAITDTNYNLFVGNDFVPSGDVFAAIKAAYDTCNVSSGIRPSNKSTSTPEKLQ